ncbi:MAG: serine/threonine protein kinase [Kofleriaceae bacterium]|nr:serine/threonine protein kinase [Kofleriaceae bacterium]
MSGAGPGAEAYCSACDSSFPAELVTCPNDGARLIRLADRGDQLLGRVLDGRYQIIDRLGKGGMGVVYRAIQLSVDREVAVKVVDARLAHDLGAAKRFLREARLASRLSQPSVVGVYDFGQTEDGVLYLVMELLRGHTLAAELVGGRRFTLRRAAGITIQLCDALEAAHTQGIIHRDLKPGNIVVLDDPPGRDLIKVLDFGLAKSLVGDSASQVTNTDAVLGTPLYMSPEAVRGQPCDQRSDLYSLGCILYELLAGRPPFVDSSANLVMAMHLGDTPPPLPEHVAPAVRTLVERLLAKEPSERVASADEVRAALQRAAAAPGDQVESADTVPEIVAPAASLMHAATLAATPTPTPTPTPNTRAEAAVPTTPAAAPVATPRPVPWARWIVLAAAAVAVGLITLAVVGRDDDGAAKATSATATGAEGAATAPAADARPAPVDAAPGPIDAPAPVDAEPARVDAPPPVDAGRRRRGADAPLPFLTPT